MFSFVVLGTWPTKGLPRNQRLPVLAQRARARYERRQLAVLWFWGWADKRWGKLPHASTKVHYSLVRALPAFARMRPRVTRFPHLNGKRVRIVGQHIHYEDCVHLYEQAHALLLRLERAAAT